MPSRSSKSGPANSPLPEWQVPLCAPHFDEAEIAEAAAVLRSGWWTYGPTAQRLEAEFAEFAGVGHAIAVSSGTAALHLAFAALGLQSGDEVLTPSLTFVAASNCILHAGGVPHFVDVASPDEPLVTCETLARAITPRTRGICVAHYAGFPCDMDSILKLARSSGLWLVEDAAHAPGAGRNGTRCGAWGDAGCFSFFGNKNLTCGEGGMITTSNDELARKIRTLRSHGMSSLTWDRHLGHQSAYDVTEAGFNYRMDDLRASVLRVQLRGLAEANRQREIRTRWYRELLGDDPRWTIPFRDHAGQSAHHLFPIVLAETLPREPIMAELKAHGIQSSIHYPPVHAFSYYRRLSLPAADLPVTEAFGRRTLTLPLYPDMTRAQVEWVCDSLRAASRSRPPAGTYNAS